MKREFSGKDRHLDVCMFVYNNFTNDSRVEKEARTLIEAGYRVTVVALLDANTQPFEMRRQIRVIRVALNPWHQRLIRGSQRLGTIKIPNPLNQPRLKEIRGPFGLPFKIRTRTILICLMIIGLIELFYHPSTMAGFQAHKYWIYGLLCAFILAKRQVFAFLKQAKRFITILPKKIQRWVTLGAKKLLMPFHRLFCFLAFYRSAYRQACETDYGVYQAHDLNTLPVAYFCARRRGANLVYDSHELYTERNKLKPSSKTWKRILGALEGFMVRRSDAVFTVNATLAQTLATRYRIPVPHVVMNTPASFSILDQSHQGNGRLRAELAVPDHQKLLLYVGAITFNRGLEELILSLKHLPDCYLVFMGYGNDAYKQSLVDLIEKHRFAERFSFFGPVPSNQVIHYAAGADLGVAPIANACLSYYCCSPNKLFEYMNAGLPVVASNFPELEKVVLGHDIGLTFDPADPADIARVIRLILDDPDLWMKMAGNAQKASGRYNWGNESRKLLKIYRSLPYRRSP